MIKNIKGILCPIFSLPSKYGIGDFGLNAFRFIDILAKYHFNAWQLLPLNPISFGNSPYQPFSSYALEEIYIDIDSLKNDGLLTENFSKYVDKKTIDYNGVKNYKHQLLKKAYDNYILKFGYDDLNDYKDNNKEINEYAMFMAFKEKNNQLPFSSWKDKLEDGLYRYYVYYHLFLQLIAFRQYEKLKRYANQNGVKIIGDLPFYVGLDSSDVYFHKNYFLLNDDDSAKYIAGVAPDYFSKTGQRWGNPIYNYEELKKDGYKFLIDRIAFSNRLYDIVRIDHFRAFDSFYQILGNEETAEHGTWKKGIGSPFFDELFKQFPNLELIAEDLGDINESVLELRDRYSLPGMNILEFNIFGIIDKNIEFKTNTFTYIGTHDNDTLKGWYNALNKKEKNKLKSYLAADDKDVLKKFIIYLLQNYSNSIVSVTDILYLDNNYRINYPSTLSLSNWSLKIKDFSKLIINLEELRWQK